MNNQRIFGLPCEKMSISVIIPLYNKVRHIRRAIDSVLAQTYSDFELIIIDDGSTDAGSMVVREISDSRVRLIVQNNAGECAARNRGIREAAYGLLAFLDADDEWSPEFLSTVLKLHEKHPKAGAYATAYRFVQGKVSINPKFRNCDVDSEGGLLPNYFRAGLGPAPITSSSVMVPRRVFDEVGAFPVGIQTGGDRYMWALIALRYRIAWSPRACAIYHLSADNRVCDNNIVTRDMAAASAVDEFFRSGGQPIVPRQSVEDFLAAARIPMALNCHLHGKHIWALELLAKTRGTREFMWKRIFIRSLIWCPNNVLLKMIKLKAVFRR